MEGKSGRKRNNGLASTVQGINNALSFDFTLKGALCEGAGSAMFFAETEGELLCLAWEPRQTEPAAKAAEEPKVNSPSVPTGQLPRRGRQNLW